MKSKKMAVIEPVGRGAVQETHGETQNTENTLDGKILSELNLSQQDEQREKLELNTWLLNLTYEPNLSLTSGT